MLVSEFYKELFDACNDFNIGDCWSDYEEQVITDIIANFGQLEPTAINAVKLFNAIPFNIFIYGDRWVIIIAHLKLFPDAVDIPFEDKLSSNIQFPYSFEFDTRYTPEMYVLACNYFNKLCLRIDEMDKYFEYMTK